MDIPRLRSVSNCGLPHKFALVINDVNKVIFVFVLVVGFSGCFRASFQPPLYTYEGWKRENTSISEVKDMMLKCGYPSVLGAGRELDNNKIALMHVCMESHGFKYAGEFGTFCESYRNLPACLEATREAAVKGVEKSIDSCRGRSLH